MKETGARREAAQMYAEPYKPKRETLWLRLDTCKPLDSERQFRAVWEAVKKLELPFFRMGETEPLKHPFDEQALIEWWAGTFRKVADGRARRNSMFCRSKKYAGSLAVTVNGVEGRDRIKTSVLLEISCGWADTHKRALTGLLRELIGLTEPVCAQICNVRTSCAVHGFRDGKDRFLKDAQWITCYTNETVGQIGERLFYEAPWTRVERLENGLLAYTSENVPRSGGEEEQVCRWIRDLFWPEYSQCETQEYFIERHVYR